jgi:glycosyltransferase involved in cell wall biosynthesis
MKVLMITGDKNLLVPGTDAYDRLQLQRAQVDELKVFFWGRGGTSAWSILRAAFHERFDVITAQDPVWRGHIAWHAARFTGARLNVQVHTDLNAYGFFKRAYAKFHLHRADSVRVVSEKIKKQLQDMGVTASIFVLPVFVDVERFRAVAPKPHEGKHILWVGRFEDEKDPQAAIRVLKEVRKQIDATLTMLGKGSLEETMHMQAQGLPVEFPGWQDPLPFLANTDAVLSTSRHESWGASIVEALAAGVTVVAPDVGVAYEAGANVVERADLAKEVVRVLQASERGHLCLTLLTKEEWAAKWLHTLQ